MAQAAVVVVGFWRARAARWGGRGKQPRRTPVGWSGDSRGWRRVLLISI
jgi:hypothetical protein